MRDLVEEVLVLFPAARTDDAARWSDQRPGCVEEAWCVLGRSDQPEVVADEHRRVELFAGGNEVFQSSGEMGVEKVEVTRIGVDPSPFPLHYDPGHPAADGDGYVLPA